MNCLILRYKIIIFVIFILSSFFIFSNNAFALTCATRITCNPGEVEYLKMSATDNAHAEFISETNYSNHVCCSESTPGVTIGTSCAGIFDVFLKLQQATNSHVESKNQPNYFNNGCISVNVGNIICNYDSSCSAGYECLAKISSSTNAHIGSCSGSSYTTSVCCKYIPVPPPPPPVVPPLKLGKVKPFIVIIYGLINWLLMLVAGLAILFLILGGIRYTKSWGDSDEMEKTKKMVVYVVLGLVIILISYSVIVTLDAIING